MRHKKPPPTIKVSGISATSQFINDACRLVSSFWLLVICASFLSRNHKVSSAVKSLTGTNSSACCCFCSTSFTCAVCKVVYKRCHWLIYSLFVFTNLSSSMLCRDDCHLSTMSLSSDSLFNTQFCLVARSRLLSSCFKVLNDLVTW